MGKGESMMDCLRDGLWFGLASTWILAGASAGWASVPVAATPLGNPGDWVTTSDYPAAALEDDLQGTVNFRLTIDTQGRVENCEIVQSSGADQLDAAACDLITQRARFSVARDAHGRPTKGAYSNRVRWVLPFNMPQPQRLDVEYAYTVEINGEISGCELVKAAGLPEDQPPHFTRPCSRPARTRPFLDEAGNPVRRRVRLQTNVRIEPAP